MSISLSRFHWVVVYMFLAWVDFVQAQPPSFWHRIRLPRFKLKRCQLFCSFSFLYVLGDFVDDCFAVRCPRSQLETSRSKECISFTIKFKALLSSSSPDVIQPYKTYQDPVSHKWLYSGKPSACQQLAPLCVLWIVAKYREFLLLELDQYRCSRLRMGKSCWLWHSPKKPLLSWLLMQIMWQIIRLANWLFFGFFDSFNYSLVKLLFNYTIVLFEGWRIFT